jgi:hypothetical protein
MAIEYPSKSDIIERLTYNVDNGLFHSKKSGRKIGYLDKDGYLVINIKGQEYRAHKLAAIILNLYEEGMEVDHVNGIRNDNRKCNIRVVTKKENAKNKRLRINNNSGIHGVSMIKETGRWRVRISTDKNRYKHIGCFISFFEACCARKSAELTYGYHLNHGRSFS